MSASPGGTLVIAEAVILRDVAYRERVKRQIAALQRLGPVALLVFGFGRSEEAKLFRARYKPAGLESMEIYLAPAVPFLGVFAFFFVTFRAWRRVRKAARRVPRIHVENLLAFLPLLGTGARARVTLVLDYHGVVPEEVRERREGLFGRVLYFLLKHLEKRALAECSGVVCVSHPFRNYLTGQFGIPADRILVAGNMIEPSFAPRPESRSYYRRLYKLEERFVIVYSGSLMRHQCPAVMARLFMAIRARVPEAYFVIFTHDQHGLRRFMLRHGPFHGDVTHMRLEHEDLPHYLALGDLAFLVREENLVNSVSSPTKFPEYLACGLPVVISPGVGDCTEIVERMGLGVVVSTADIEAGAEKVASFIESSRAAREELRQKCRKAAFDLFTERDHDVLSGFYRALETGGGR